MKKTIMIAAFIFTVTSQSFGQGPVPQTVDKPYHTGNSANNSGADGFDYIGNWIALYNYNYQSGKYDLVGVKGPDGKPIPESVYNPTNPDNSDTTKPKKGGEDTGGSEAIEVTEPEPLPPAETSDIPSINNDISAPSGDPGTVAINTTTTIGGSGTGITVMQPPTFTATTPCQKASEQLGKQNLKTRIKELNGKTSGNHEWGQVIKESFQNNVDFSKNINGIIQSVDDLTEDTDAFTDPADGTTVYPYKIPKFSLDNKPEDNPRVIGFMHSHPFSNSCFSPADMMIFKNACEGSVDESVTPAKLNNTFDNVERANYFKDAIGIMIDDQFAYTIKITDPASFCDLMSSNSIKNLQDDFDDKANTKTPVGTQGQIVAFLQIFGNMCSLQRAEIDNKGNLSDFNSLELDKGKYDDSNANNGIGGSPTEYTTFKSTKCK